MKDIIVEANTARPQQSRRLVGKADPAPRPRLGSKLVVSNIIVSDLFCEASMSFEFSYDNSKQKLAQSPQRSLPERSLAQRLSDDACDIEFLCHHKSPRNQNIFLAVICDSEWKQIRIYINSLKSSVAFSISKVSIRRHCCCRRFL